VADDVGALLLRAGLIAGPALERARDEKARRGGTTAERLVEVGAIPDEALTQFLATHLMLPRVPADALAAIPAKVRGKLPADLATELRAVPISIDGEGNLTVALSDPSDEHTVEQIRFFTGAYVVRAVCTQMQLAWCLAHYYGHLTDLGRSLALAAANPAAAAAKIRRRDEPSFSEEETGVTGPMQRIKLPPPSAEELAPRSGVIETQAGAVVEQVRLPAVVVEELEVVPGAPIVGDSEPVILEKRAAPPVEIEEVGADGVSVKREAVPGEASDDVVLLRSARPSGRKRTTTAIGIGRAGSSRDTDVEAMMAAQGGKDRERNKRESVDDGWDVDDGWGPPGTTIPPALIGARPEALEPADSSRIPLAVDEAASGAVSAPIAVPAASPPAAAAPSARPGEPGPSAEAVAASADRLLGALRALDEADSRDAVVEAAMSFVQVASSRVGFAARKGEALVSHRGPGAALAAELPLEAGPMIATLGRSGPFRGAVGGGEASFIGSLLGALPASVSAVPVVVRARLVGAFFAESTPALVDEHVAVVARAAGLALERVLMKQKK
jgi:hypothetical protein